MNTQDDNDLKEPLIGDTLENHPDTNTNTTAKKSGNNRRFSFDRSPLEIIITDYYYVIATICSFTFGLHYFLMEVVQLDNPPSFRYLYAYGFSFFISFLVYHTVRLIMTKIRYGTFWSNRRSLYFKPDGSMNKVIVKVSIYRSISSIGIAIASFSMIYYAVAAGVNASVIVTITSFSIFATALYFKFFFAQELQKEHYIGMVLMLGCIVLSTISFPAEEEVAVVQTDVPLKEEKEKLSIMYPVFFALLSSFFFTWN
jgi:drug/metabolite transporter (DMT)-like permease